MPETPMPQMPPLQFAETNSIRIGYYEAGPKTDATPIVLCHGWPEIAFSWRHQIQTLSEAGLRVIAPDQRGYGATDRPEAVEAYDLEHLTGDLVGLRRACGGRINRDRAVHRDDLPVTQADPAVGQSLGPAELRGARRDDRRALACGCGGRA